MLVGMNIAPPLRALTVKQPWAWAILHAGKRVENRPCVPGAARPLLIHAGRSVDPDDIGQPADLPRGVSYALASVVSWHHADECRAACSPWALPDLWHWVLDDVRPARQVPLRGQLGLWVPDDVTYKLD